MSHIIEVTDLVKTYGNFEAVRGISFHVEKGEILGFLGPNGAGKTTTIQMLLQIVTPTSGNIHIFDKEVSKHREEVLQRMNFTSAYVHLFGSLTVWENLKVFAKLYGVKGYDRIHSLLKEFEAENLKEKKAATLSSGQLTRVMVIKALLNEPELLLLDEPTSSLDPDIAEKMREILMEVRRSRGLSMVYTSHNMAEIEEMCDRVVFLSKGKIVENDTPAKLRSLIPDHTLTVTFDTMPKDIDDFIAKHNLTSEKKDTKLSVTSNNEGIPQLLQDMYSRNYTIQDIRIEEPDLEDVFLKIARGE